MDYVNIPRTSAAAAGPDASGEAARTDEDALRRCRRSQSLFQAGDFEGAREALGELWPGAGARPAVEGFGARAAAEVLVQAGRLTSALGGSRRSAAAQEAAKNLLSEGAELFERLGDAKKLAEARAELGLCYWREGAFEEARVLLRSALEVLPPEEGEQRATTLVRLTTVEFSARRYEAVLALLGEAAPLVEASRSDYLKGCFHNHRAVTLRALADAGDDAELRDRALVEYAAASFHFEQSGHTRYHANTENNLAFLYNTIGRHAQAHEHLARARALFAALKDTTVAAQCDDTLARILVAEGRFEEAEAAARCAVRALEGGDRQALLAEALTTLGVAQARAGRPAEARASLARAAEVADAAGDRAGAGLAALTLAEELGGHLGAGELCGAFARAHELLSGTRSAVLLARLNACARRALESSSSPGADACADAGSPEERWEGFSLKSEVHRYEAEVIERALHDAEGVVSRAAKLLGFRHHQTFVALLNNRHRGLLHARRPAVPRRRSIMHRRPGKKG